MLFNKLNLRFWKKLCFFLNPREAVTKPNIKINKAITGFLVSNNEIEKIE